jgi:hypothetical protein
MSREQDKNGAPTMTGAFMLICSALAPMILARSYFVMYGVVVRTAAFLPSLPDVAEMRRAQCQQHRA